MKKIIWLGIIKKLVMIAVFVLYPAVADACMVTKDWTDKTRARFDRMDKNKDGMLQKEEFMAQKNKKQYILDNEWAAENVAQKGYITKDEFVTREHPKCIEVRK